MNTPADFLTSLKQALFFAAVIGGTILYLWLTD